MPAVKAVREAFQQVMHLAMRSQAYTMYACLLTHHMLSRIFGAFDVQELCVCLIDTKASPILLQMAVPNVLMDIAAPCGGLEGLKIDILVAAPDVVRQARSSCNSCLSFQVLRPALIICVSSYFAVHTHTCRQLWMCLQSRTSPLSRPAQQSLSRCRSTSACP